MDFSLRVNRKQIATNSSPYRDQQFQHICSLRTRFQRQGLPIISVDSKKREMIGNFKNAGAKWDRSPVLVNDHDFLTDASGVGISYGIYDPPHNRGTVCVGISHDTPAFAAHSIATWWKREGTRRYGRAPKLLLLADSGGSNSCTSWAWKIELQTSAMQSLRPRSHHRSLSYRCLQMESHRAPVVLRDLQKLGCRAPGQLRKDAQIHSHHQHQNWLGRDRLSRPKRVSNPSQARPTIDLFTPPHPWQSNSAMELHDSTESVKLFLRRP